jgi:hypothetical protein
MTTALQRRRGTASNHSSFTGLDGEITVNTTNKSVHVHDGTTAGGFELLREDLSNLTDITTTVTFSDNTELRFGDDDDITIKHGTSGSTINAAANLSLSVGGTTKALVTNNGLETSGDAKGTRFKTTSAGSASIPAYGLATDVNTGMFFPTQDTLGFSEGGAERARINSSGQLLVGTTSGGSYNAKIRATARIEGSGFVGTSNASQFLNGGFMGDATINVNSWTGYSSSSQKLMSFQGSTGSERGTITMAGTSTQYNTTSDERAKENIQDAGDAGAKIDAIQIRQFDWKEDGAHQDFGVIAQELQSVAPEAVTEGFDEEDMWSVDYSKLVPTLIKEIQSLRNRVAQLENE